MNITVAVVNEFKYKVVELIRQYNLVAVGVCQDTFLIELYKYAAQVSSPYIPARLELASVHKTGVDCGRLDYNMMMMSITSICWAVRIRKLKLFAGQCHEHKNDWDEARKFHAGLSDQWINGVEEALQSLRSDRPSAIV